MVQEELCRLALQAAEDAYIPTNEHDFENLFPPEDYQVSFIWDDPTTGFKAVLYVANDHENNSAIIAFTGTENELDAISDLSLGWDQWQANRDEFFRELNRLQASSLIFTGHSLGGALAQYATYDYLTGYGADSTTQLSLVTFNALGGITGLETNVPEFDIASLPSIDSAHFVVDGDLVSRLGDGHLGGEVYLLQRVTSGTFIDPLVDRALDLENTPFNMLAGHMISNVNELVAIEGFQHFQTFTPDYFDISAIQPLASTLTLATLDAAQEMDRTIAINVLAAGLTRTLAHVGNLPEDDPQREQLETLISGVTSNLREGTRLTEANGVLYTVLDQIDWVGLASIPYLNDLIDDASFFYNMQVLLADAMRQPDSKLGIEGADAFASLLIDYASTVGVDLSIIEEDLHSRLVERFTAGVMFTDIDINGHSQLLVAVLDELVMPAWLEHAESATEAGVFRIGGNALVPGDGTSPRQIEGSESDDILLGQGSQTEVQHGHSGNDLLYGALGRDLLYGGSGDDWLLGGEGDDVIDGGADNDILEDGAGADDLHDPSGNDRYVMHNDGVMDTIIDRDGIGSVFLGGKQLHGGMSIEGSATHYSDGEHHYRVVGGDLVIDETVTLRDWEEGELGITLYGAPPPSESNLMIGSEGPDTSSVLVSTDGDDVIYGMGGDDELRGGLGDDQLYGGSGSDWLSATPGNDLLDGGMGDDVLISGIDHDTLLGGSGDDFLSAGDGHDRLDGGPDADVLAAGAGDDLLAGGEGDDRLYGDGTFEPLNRNWSVVESASDDGIVITVLFDQVVGAANSSADGNDILSGGAGNDDLMGGGGNDHLSGESGHDYLDGGHGDDKLDGGMGDDSLHGDAKLGDAREADGADTLLGGPGNDWLEGGYGADHLEGNSGNDELHGDYLDDPLRGGPDSLHGGAGDDLLLGGAGDDSIHGGEGIDRIDAGPGRDRVWGGSDDDTLLGDAGADMLHGGLGDDLLLGGDGDDGLDGSDGHDRLEGGAGNDRALGGSGDDIVIGGEGGDHLSGGGGQDLLDGGPGADRLAGGDGNDHLQSGTENDWLDGGAGDDTLLGQQGHDELHGGEGHDRIAGGTGRDLIYGDSGDDQLWGEADDDRIEGGPGHDTLAGGPDNDTLLGGDGDDRLFGEDGDDRLYGDDGADLLAGGPGDDQLEAGPGNDLLYGESGNDQLNGGEGADFIAGGPGVDELSGGHGDDELHGENGNDWLRGGAGNDTLAGGSGDDRYQFELDDAQITIIEQGDSLGDTLTLGSGLAATDFAAGRVSDDLILQHLAGEQRITIVDWFASPYNRLSAISFENGTTWNPADLAAAETTLLGSHGEDVLLGDLYNETLLGLGGADQLEGSDGNDLLSGGKGIDHLSGGRGDDLLEGGEGSDTFHFTVGDGVDRLLDAESEDALQFSNSNPEGLSFQVNWNTAGHQLDLLYGVNDRVLIDGGLLLTDLTIMLTDSGATYRLDELLAEVADREGRLEHVVTPRTTPVNGTRHADHIVGSEAGDILLGLDGDDLVEAGGGDDLLDGGNGNDQLHGGTGIDTYRYGLGSGHDTLVETSPLETSVIDIGSGLTQADLIMHHDGDDLRLVITESGESLTYLDWRDRRDVAPLEVRFTDGTLLTEIDLRLKIQTGTEGNDTLRSNPRAKRLQGLAGDDRLLGKSGDDVLVGGAGHDILHGGDGSDTYLFASGSGSDRILESSDDPLASDRVTFGSGTQPSDLVFSRHGDDLLVERLHSGDRIEVTGWYADEGATIEEFQAADGSILHGADVNRLIESMANFTEATGVDWANAIEEDRVDVRLILTSHWESSGQFG